MIYALQDARESVRSAGRRMLAVPFPSPLQRFVISIHARLYRSRSEPVAQDLRVWHDARRCLQRPGSVGVQYVVLSLLNLISTPIAKVLVVRTLTSIRVEYGGRNVVRLHACIIGVRPVVYLQRMYAF